MCLACWKADGESYWKAWTRTTREFQTLSLGVIILQNICILRNEEVDLGSDSGDEEDNYLGVSTEAVRSCEGCHWACTKPVLSRLHSLNVL